MLEIFLGIDALFGGGVFILVPDGHLLGMTTRTLAGSPFRSYLVPGIILIAVVGVAPLLAAAIIVRRQAIAPLAAVAAGLMVIGWISVEIMVLAGSDCGGRAATGSGEVLREGRPKPAHRLQGWRV